MKITVTTLLHATEDTEKIKKAVEKVFPGMQFKISRKEIKGESSDSFALSYVREKIISKQIKSTARYLFLEYKTDKGTRFMLNKQTLMIGKVNFVEEEYVLGNVIADIETDNFEGFIDFMTGMIN